MSGSQNTGDNPLLLNPQASYQGVVPPVAGFTAPYPIKLQDKGEFYAMTMANHHMHRADGKRLSFPFGIFETADVYDIDYLNKEIAAGNPYLRHATEAEVLVHKMRTDPRKTLTEQLTPGIEEEVRLKLVAHLESLGVRLTPDQSLALQTHGAVKQGSEEEADKLKAEHAKAGYNPEAKPAPAAELLAKLHQGTTEGETGHSLLSSGYAGPAADYAAQQEDRAKIEGVDSKVSKEPLESGKNKIYPTQSAPADVTSRLQGMVGTNRTTTGVDSNSEGVSGTGKADTMKPL